MISDKPVYKKSEYEPLLSGIHNWRFQKFAEFIIKSKELNKNLFFQNKAIELPWEIWRCSQCEGSFRERRKRNCCWSRGREGTWRSGWTVNCRLRARDPTSAARSTETYPPLILNQKHIISISKIFIWKYVPIWTEKWNFNSKNKIFLKIWMSEYWLRNFSEILTFSFMLR